MAVISHGLILALLPHGWIHHSPTDSSMDFDKSPSDFGEPKKLQYDDNVNESHINTAVFMNDRIYSAAALAPAVLPLYSTMVRQ